jgi:adenosine deaminase
MSCRWLIFVLASGCGSKSGGVPDDGFVMGVADMSVAPDLAGSGGPCGTRPECAAAAEDATATRFDGLSDGDRPAFLAAMPKGGDLHNHLSGAVYAETYLGWGKADNDCINSTTFAAVFNSQCSASTMPVPDPGAFYDQIVAAWSMKGFVAGAENGHDHFFATFGKYGAIAGGHRDDSLADLMTRAASENQLYLETMFNLGKNVGTLAASKISGTVTADMLQTYYDSVVNDPTFAAEVDSDVAVVTSAENGYKSKLGCSGATPPAACGVDVRFVAQVSRTGSNDTIFGQLISAFEMAQKSARIVGANLSSPEDDTSALKNYDLHMAMLDFLYGKYHGKSPLHVTLHAGELVPQYLPSGYATANTFHIRHAVETAHAERIGHGVDIMTETDPAGLMAEMKANNVLVEVCLSSNDQILGVSGTNHPLAAYLAAGVPVALATDDQGVSRSSLAGELVKAAQDQKLGYKQLKTLARNSLEHAFIAGEDLWTAPGVPVPDCAPNDTLAIGDAPSAACQSFLDANPRAKLQWELERRFLVFEK